MSSQTSMTVWEKMVVLMYYRILVCKHLSRLCIMSQAKFLEKGNDDTIFIDIANETFLIQCKIQLKSRGGRCIKIINEFIEYPSKYNRCIQRSLDIYLNSVVIYPQMLINYTQQAFVILEYYCKSATFVYHQQYFSL